MRIVKMYQALTNTNKDFNVEETTTYSGKIKTIGTSTAGQTLSINGDYAAWKQWLYNSNQGADSVISETLIEERHYDFAKTNDDTGTIIEIEKVAYHFILGE